MTVKILVGDVRAKLAEMPDESVHCVVTSPPYFGLRDYQTASWEDGDPACDHVSHNQRGDTERETPGGKGGSFRGGTVQFQGLCGKCGATRADKQIGLEETPAAYVETMVAVFREVRRVLRSDGTLWLNLGDSYSSHPKGNPGERGNINGGKRDTTAADIGSTIDKSRLPGLKPKDLIGIPWRVAFALQAPDYLGRIRNESDRAWLAALTDGEGCITILEAKSPHGSGSSFPPILQVRMCDPECIEKAMGLVGSEGENPPRYPASMEGHRPAYQWRIHGRKAVDTIAEIYPFLLIKRKQAIVAWNHQAVRDSYETKKGVKIPADALAKQQLCREIIQKLNKREPVDLPSWMVEPPQPIGPGWYLRQDVIWSKPNPMPESVTDRCTKAHEYLFLLSKSARYHYDADAIKEPASENTHARGSGIGVKNATIGKDSGVLHNGDYASKINGLVDERNRRSVWTVATQPFSQAHFATFPPALIEPCILAGCPKDCCIKCGAPVVRQISRPAEKTILPSNGQKSQGLISSGGMSNSLRGSSFHGPGWRNAEPDFTLTVGWFPSCSCTVDTSGENAIKNGNQVYTRGTVLDPFGGAGTTGLVADRLQRNAILIELNPEYAAMAEQRIRQDAPLFAALGQ